jgi:hypothetical protein
MAGGRRQEPAGAGNEGPAARVACQFVSLTPKTLRNLTKIHSKKLGRPFEPSGVCQLAKLRSDPPD